MRPLGHHSGCGGPKLLPNYQAHTLKCPQIGVHPSHARCKASSPCKSLGNPQHPVLGWLWGGYLPCLLLLFPQEAPQRGILPNDGSFTDSVLCPQGLSHREHSIDGFAAGILANARKASDNVGCLQGYCYEDKCCPMFNHLFNSRTGKLKRGGQ